ncbi:MAG: alpha/beta fold hydrolase, partial [Glaciecola sp.]
ILVLLYSILPARDLYTITVKTERFVAGLKAKSQTIEEGTISYLYRQSDTPKAKTLVMLHGFGADKDNWNRISVFLKQHFTLVIPDLPPFGNSFVDPTHQYHVDKQVARLSEFLETINHTDIIIAGNSMGGYIAAAYAARHPEDVEQVWLLNPLGVNHAPPSEMVTRMTNGEPPLVLPDSPASFRRLLDSLFVSQPFIPDRLIDYLGRQRTVTYSLFQEVFNDIHPNRQLGGFFFDPSLQSLISEITAPVLVSWGDQDKILNIGGANILKNEYPHLQFTKQANLGHLPMIEAPRATANIFLKFHQSQAPSNELPTHSFNSHQ